MLFFVTLLAVPSNPQITVSGRSNEPNELLVNWTAPDSPNGIILYYTVYCNKDDDQGSSGILTPDVVVTVLGSYHSALVTGLTPYTLYNCYVTATTSAGEGNSSMVVTAQTDESGKLQYLISTGLKCFFAEPGDAPTNFKSVVVNSTAIQLTWDEPQLPYGIILSYTITYNTSHGDVSHVQSSTEPRVIIIDGLQEHTWYRFEIFASTRIGAGPQTYAFAMPDPDSMTC